MKSSAPPRTQVFVSYSHQNKAALERLQVHLAPLRRAGLIDLWDDTQIEPGQLWEDEIKAALAAAKVAVLLVSADFLDSDFIDKNELPPLLAAEASNGLVILPVVLEPCFFGDSPLSAFQAVNPPNKPLSAMSKDEREQTWVALAKRIKELANTSSIAERHAGSQTAATADAGRVQQQIETAVTFTPAPVANQGQSVLSVDRDDFLDALAGLSDIDLDKIVLRLPGARGHVVDRAPVEERVNQLVVWAESIGGPEGKLETVYRVFHRLFPDVTLNPR